MPKLGVSKKRLLKFKPEETGYLRIAGESFFLHADGTTSAYLSDSIADDSLKGDRSFERLFLSGFTDKAVQATVRRLFQTHFRSGDKFQVPCKKKEAELILSALHNRREKLREQIGSYDELSIDTLSTRYSREHMRQLNQLIEQEIPAAYQKPCLDPEGSTDERIPDLDDATVEKLLQVFGFLLAQKGDPMDAFTGTTPQQHEIVAAMLKLQTSLQEYEAEYERAKGEKPVYTGVLLSIRQILTGLHPPTTASSNTQTDLSGIPISTNTQTDLSGNVPPAVNLTNEEILKEIETKLGLPSVADPVARKAALLTKLQSALDEIQALTKRWEECDATRTALTTAVSEIGTAVGVVVDSTKPVEETKQSILTKIQEMGAPTVAGPDPAAQEAALLKLKEANDAVVIKQQTLAALLAEIAAKQQARDALLAEIATKQATSDEAQGRLAGITTEIAAQQATKAALEADILRLQGAHQSANTLSADAAASEASKQELEARVRELMDENEELKGLTHDQDAALSKQDECAAQMAELDRTQQERIAQITARYAELLASINKYLSVSEQLDDSDLFTDETLAALVKPTLTLSLCTLNLFFSFMIGHYRATLINTKSSDSDALNRFNAFFENIATFSGTPEAVQPEIVGVMYTLVKTVRAGESVDTHEPVAIEKLVATGPFTPDEEAIAFDLFHSLMVHENLAKYRNETLKLVSTDVGQSLAPGRIFSLFLAFVYQMLDKKSHDLTELGCPLLQ